MQLAPAREALWLPSLFQVVCWPLWSHGPHTASITVTAVHLQNLISTQTSSEEGLPSTGAWNRHHDTSQLVLKHWGAGVSPFFLFDALPVRQSLPPPLILLFFDSPNLEAPLRLGQAGQKMNRRRAKGFFRGDAKEGCWHAWGKGCGLEVLLRGECTNEPWASS